MEIPVISQDLIDYLGTQFPDKCPDVSDTERKIWTDVGASLVVRHLQRVKEDQEENILTNR
tara:strand:- start:8450 stop:8632 length:183 start_codon:yes stop_codon:yes gene_type:complete